MRSANAVLLHEGTETLEIEAWDGHECPTSHADHVQRKVEPVNVEERERGEGEDATARDRALKGEAL